MHEISVFFFPSVWDEMICSIYIAKQKNKWLIHAD